MEADGCIEFLVFRKLLLIQRNERGFEKEMKAKKKKRMDFKGRVDEDASFDLMIFGKMIIQNNLRGAGREKAEKKIRCRERLEEYACIEFMYFRN